MKYQWQQQNFDPHRLSTIVSSSSYILSNIFKKPPEFLVWGEEKRKTKVTVFKEGRGNIFFIEWDFLCWRYNQIFSFILLDHLKNRKKQKLEMRFFVVFWRIIFGTHWVKNQILVWKFNIRFFPSKNKFQFLVQFST